jgi:hypothetical protein
MAPWRPRTSIAIVAVRWNCNAHALHASNRTCGTCLILLGSAHVAGPPPMTSSTYRTARVRPGAAVHRPSSAQVYTRGGRQVRTRRERAYVTCRPGHAAPQVFFSSVLAWIYTAVRSRLDVCVDASLLISRWILSWWDHTTVLCLEPIKLDYRWATHREKWPQKKILSITHKPAQ